MSARMKIAVCMFLFLGISVPAKKRVEEATGPQREIFRLSADVVAAPDCSKRTDQGWGPCISTECKKHIDAFNLANYNLELEILADGSEAKILKETKLRDKFSNMILQAPPTGKCPTRVKEDFQKVLNGQEGKNAPGEVR